MHDCTSPAVDHAVAPPDVDVVSSEQVEIGRLRREADDLRAALESRPVIDQAKGILMAMYAIDPEQAFQLLCRWSQTHNIKLRELAASLVERTTADSRRPAAPSDLTGGGGVPRTPSPRAVRGPRPPDPLG